MKKLIIAIAVTLFAGLGVFLGCQFLILTTKASIVDQPEYLGVHNNPADIYAAPSSGPVYSPINIDVIPMDKLMLIDIEDDPEYACIELQTFDDNRGRGARVLLYHHKGPADSYYTDKIFETEDSGIDKSYIVPDMNYHLDVTDAGLNASLSMRDRHGKRIEFRIKETLRKKWSQGFLAPIGSSDAVTFPYFPLFYMKNMNFVLRSGTEITVAIGGKERKPKILPIPANWEFVYFSRYTPAPIIARVNRPFDGKLHPFQAQGRIYRGENYTYELVDNNGHYEIQKILGFNEKHNAGLRFSPAIPDLVNLKDGLTLEGRFCAFADGVAGIVAGVYTVSRRENLITLEIRPQEGWQPAPGQPWVRTWVWKGAITVASDHTVALKSAWIRQQ